MLVRGREQHARPCSAQCSAIGARGGGGGGAVGTHLCGGEGAGTATAASVVTSGWHVTGCARPNPPHPTPPRHRVGVNRLQFLLESLADLDSRWVGGWVVGGWVGGGWVGGGWVGGRTAGRGGNGGQLVGGQRHQPAPHTPHPPHTQPARAGEPAAGAAGEPPGGAAARVQGVCVEGWGGEGGGASHVRAAVCLPPPPTCLPPSLPPTHPPRRSGASRTSALSLTLSRTHGRGKGAHALHAARGLLRVVSVCVHVCVGGGRWGTRAPTCCLYPPATRSHASPTHPPAASTPRHTLPRITHPPTPRAAGMRRCGSWRPRLGWRCTAP